MSHDSSDGGNTTDANTVPDDRIDAAIAVVILVGAGFFLLQSQQLAGSNLPTSEADPGPTFWPQAILITILITGLINLWWIYTRMRATEQAADKTEWSISDGLTAFSNPSKEQTQYVVAIIALVTYLGLLEPIGFVAATPAFLFVFAWINDYRSLIKMSLFSVGTTILLFLVFRNLMNLALPYGSGPIREISILLEGLF